MFSWKDINLKLLPMKGHFYFFNAGTATFVPYLPTFARQLGFSPSTIGFIYLILPMTGLFAKPLFGAIADRFKIQKTLFIFFQVVCLTTFCAIYLTPQATLTSKVELDCNNGFTVLKSTLATHEEFDKDSIIELSKSNGTAECSFECDMSWPKMWRTVCDQWDINKYCLGDTRQIFFNSIINDVTLKEKCIYMSSSNVTLDGHNYFPGCHNGEGYVNIDEECSFECTDKFFTSAISKEVPKMTCLKDKFVFEMCDADANLFSKIQKVNNASCNVTCDLSKSQPWHLMEICKGWKAEDAPTCQHKTASGNSYPAYLPFNGTVQLSTSVLRNNTFYFRLHDVIMPSGGIFLPNCNSKSQYQMSSALQHAPCKVLCNHSKMNQVLYDLAPNYLDDKSEPFSWFLSYMALNWISMAIIVTFSDAICFSLLDDSFLYGKQRLWGSIGWGVFTILTGYLIDITSYGTMKNYWVAFLLMFICLIGDVIMSSFITVKSTKMSLDFWKDIGTLFSSWANFVFTLSIICIGFCTAFIWQFLFMYLEDLSPHNSYSKTLQGLVSATQTFAGEMPFMFLSGYIIPQFGHSNVMSMVLFAFGFRFLFYAMLSSPWFVLPVEILQGITTGLFYPAMTSYATRIARRGCGTTMQGLVGAIHEGIGVALGSWIGGKLYAKMGGRHMFGIFGYLCLTVAIIHVLAQHVIKMKSAKTYKPREINQPSEIL